MAPFAGWAPAVLKRLGMPITPANVAFLTKWQSAEGGTATYNPLNTTQSWAGATNYNSVGVKNYSTPAVGLDATVKTLTNGYYNPILDQLKTGAPRWTPEVGKALNTWGTGSSWLRGFNPGTAVPTPKQQADSIRPPAASVKANIQAFDPTTFMAQQFQNQARNTIIQQSIQLAQTGDVSGYAQSLIGLAAQRRQMDATIKAFGPVSPAAEQSAQQYGGTTAYPSAKGVPPAGHNALINKVLAVAHSEIGKPYKWGAESPQEGGFDCSGLIDYAYKQAGYDFPGRLTTYSALQAGKSVKGQKYMPGDLIVVNGGKHMVMYVGNNTVIAAPHSGSVVQYQPLSQFEGSIVDVRRI